MSTNFYGQSTNKLPNFIRQCNNIEQTVEPYILLVQ